MKKYIEPEMECVLFSAEDIISTSSKVPYPGDNENEPIATVDPDEGIIV